MRLSTSLVTRGAIVLGATLLVVGPTVTHAADQLILGKKLLIKNPPSGAAGNKVVHLGKDPAITVGAAGSAGDPQCTGAGGGGTSSLRITVSGGPGDVVIPLACAGWTTNGANTLYKYKDPTAATCKLVLVKGGVLVKAVCKGPQVAVDLNGTVSPVAVVTTLNTQEYCTEFGGTVVKDGSDDKTFLRKDAAAPTGCAPLTCPSGQMDCGAGCVDLSIDASNCGTCGTVCLFGESCVSGVCCEACGGMCVDLQTDPSNCGTCETVCPFGESCVGGVCCEACGGACTDLQNDPNNCGTCGTACAIGESCVSGTCCPACAGVCVDLQTDPNNCGTCGTVCPFGESCVSGTCV